jgi:hypothetical protein
VARAAVPVAFLITAAWIRAEFPDEASIASLRCHPDGGSNVTGWKDLGQQGASTAGSGF